MESVPMQSRERPSIVVEVIGFSVLAPNSPALYTPKGSQSHDSTFGYAPSSALCPACSDPGLASADHGPSIWLCQTFLYLRLALDRFLGFNSYAYTTMAIVSARGNPCSFQINKCLQSPEWE